MSKYGTGLGNVGSYQASGVPYASGSINCSAAVQDIVFPSVTRWVQVHNNSAGDLYVGFSAKGVAGTNHVIVEAGKNTGRLEMKVTALYLSGASCNTASVVAGLTYINKGRVDQLTGSILDGNDEVRGVNWSGSAGVG